MPNKQNVQEAAATATRTAESFFMEAAEIEDIVRSEANRITPDVAMDIMLAIIKSTNTEENEDCSRLDKILWSIRSSYLIGFQKALECYSEGIKQTLQEV